MFWGNKVATELDHQEGSRSQCAAGGGVGPWVWESLEKSAGIPLACRSLEGPEGMSCPIISH